jgi:hypothetical protein
MSMPEMALMLLMTAVAFFGIELLMEPQKAIDTKPDAVINFSLRINQNIRGTAFNRRRTIFSV